MAKKSKDQVAAERSERVKDRAEMAKETREKMETLREERKEAIKGQTEEQRERLLRDAEDQEEEEQPDPYLLTGKPGSGAGLKPGDWFAPESNPGAAARVPAQPLQPESLQSHGKGILHDKDLENGPFNGVDDPEEIDAAP